VVLKDVFELSLEEVAEALSTTTGAVKAALHRARGKLAETEAAPARVPAPGVLDTFCAAFNAADMDRLTALLLDRASVEVVGATIEYGPEAARKTVLWGMLFGVKILVDPDAKVGIDWQLRKDALPTPPRAELRNHRGEWLVLHWYAHHDGDAVRAITRLELDGERISALRNYFYNPEFVADVCGELGVPFRSNGHRWWKREEA
jgi:RNA polymerase sigma-70 factor (ECF subfamily)